MAWNPRSQRNGARHVVAATLILLSPISTQAQVIEVADDGSFAVHAGPIRTSDDGVQPIQPVHAFSAARVVPAGSTFSPVADGTDLFRSAAAEAGVDPRLISAVAWQESRYRQTAVSPRGAIGMMQLMPATARMIGVDPTDMTQNVRGGAWLLSDHLRRYSGDLRLALAAYNAGEHAVHRFGGVPPFTETQKYVSAIMERLSSSISKNAVHLEKAP